MIVRSDVTGFSRGVARFASHADEPVDDVIFCHIDYASTLVRSGILPLGWRRRTSRNASRETMPRTMSLSETSGADSFVV